MEEFVKQLKVNSNGQLYHILKTNTFTFCLICLEDINTTASDGIGEHLTSTNHTESIKRLFKACNPSLLDEVENERFADIVSKSVFDISGLLGKETCYVTKKEECWFCLMCETSIIESNDVDAVIKDGIINHILTDSHVKNVKGVRFLYMLNANQDFLLLNKSLVHCFVCKDVMQCKELDLLKTAVVHLEMKHPNYVISHNLKQEPSFFVECKESKMTEQGFVDARILGDLPNTQNIPRTEVAEEGNTSISEFCRNVKYEHFDKHEGIKAENLVGVSEHIFVDNYVPNLYDVKESFLRMPLSEEIIICICLKCKKLVTPTISNQSFLVTLSSHFKQKHINFYLKTPLSRLIDWVTFQNNDPDKFKLISQVKRVKKCHRKIINCRREVRKYFNHMSQTKTDFVCIICTVNLSSCFCDNDVLFERIIKHFRSASHHRCKEENKIIKQAFEMDNNSKAVVKLTVQKEILKEEKRRRKAEMREKRARKR